MASLGFLGGMISRRSFFQLFPTHSKRFDTLILSYNSSSSAPFLQTYFGSTSHLLYKGHFPDHSNHYYYLFFPRAWRWEGAKGWEEERQKNIDAWENRASA